jgi:hypothetical protein
MGEREWLRLNDWSLIDVREVGSALKLDVIVNATGEIRRGLTLAEADFPEPLQPEQVTWLIDRLKEANDARAAETRRASRPAGTSDGSNAVALHQVSAMAAEMRGLRAELAKVSADSDARVRAALEATTRSSAAAISAVEKLGGEMKNTLGGVAALVAGASDEKEIAVVGADGKTRTAVVRRRTS